MAFNTQALSRYHAEQHYTTSRTDLATPTLMHNHQLREQSLCRFVVNRHWPTKQQGMTVHFDCSLLIKGWLDHMRQIYSIAFFGGFWSGLIMLESINLSEISRSRPTVSASTPTLLLHVLAIAQTGHDRSSLDILQSSACLSSHGRLTC